MPQTCKACDHPRRAEIDSALATGQANRDVAGRFGISKSAIQRHQGHACAGIVAAAERRTIQIAHSTLAGLETVQDKA